MNLPKYAYFKGKIVPYSEAKVGVLTHAMNYGTSVFGGIRGYWNDEEEQLFIYRPHDHYQRVMNSAKIMCMEFAYTVEELTQVTVELLQAEGYRRDVYIRPLAYKADESIGVRLHNLHDELTIVSLPFDRYVANDTDARLTFSSWRRIDDNMIPARGKIGGAYVNSALIKSDALLSGFDEALVLTEDGHVSEGSAENVFIVRNGQLITPPVTDNILEGITRHTIIRLAKQELGIPVVERSIDRTEVYLADELFLTGTAAQVTVATHIDHRPIGSGAMGPIASQLRQLYQDVVRGRMVEYRHWVTPVYVWEGQMEAG